jgi:hypothetical protein
VPADGAPAAAAAPDEAASTSGDAPARTTFDAFVAAAKPTYGTWPSAPRPNQEAVLLAVEEGSDCVAILATGLGKTLCFALPAAAAKAKDNMVTVVITMRNHPLGLAVPHAPRSQRCARETVDSGPELSQKGIGKV